MADDELLPLSDADFGFVSGLLYERFGIRLGPQKRLLVAGRLTKRIRQLGLGSFGDYCELLRSDGGEAELSEFINRLATNHSYFYRERDHFDFLVSTVFPALKAALEAEPRRPVRIWSAGCAAGEEVYTIAAVARDFFGPLVDQADFGILATDISLDALRSAMAGVYPAQRLAELPQDFRAAYFRALGDGSYEILPELRRMVLFKRLNLMDRSYPFKGSFDLIFCRNVMIYFDSSSRSALIRAFYRWTKPGGYLLIGHSETIPRNDCPFEYLGPAIYRRGVA